MKQNNQLITGFLNTALCGILLFVFSNTIYSQKTYPLNFTMKLKVQDGDLKNVMITITKKRVPFKVIDPNLDKYPVDLPLDNEYYFTYSKIGYISKTVFVDTHVPDKRGESEFDKTIYSIELEKQPEDRVIVYSQPVARFAYSNQKDDFSFDKDYAELADKMMKKEIAPPDPKAKRTSPPIPKTPPIKVVLKPTENKKSNPSTKAIAKNKEVKVIQEDTKKITVITVSTEEKSYIYRKEEYSFGAFFYKDGKSITSDTFDNETK